MVGRHFISGSRFYLKYINSKNCRFRNIYTCNNYKCLYSSAVLKADDFGNTNSVILKESIPNTNSTPSEENNSLESPLKEKQSSVNKVRGYGKKPRYIEKNTCDVIDSDNTLRRLKNVILSSLEESHCTGPYLMDKKVASHVAKVLIPELNPSNSAVMEANPGIGLLTEKLINSGVHNIRLFEPSENFYNRLMRKKALSGKVTHINVLSLKKLTFLDTVDGGTRVADIFSNVPSRNWEEEPVFQMIAPISNKFVVQNILETIMLHNVITEHGRPEFFFMMDPLTYTELTNNGEKGYVVYRAVSVCFQIIFDSKVLCEVPRKAFLPVTKMRVNLKSPYCRENAARFSDLMYLVKVTAKPEVADLIRSSQLDTLYYFIKQLLRSPKKRALPFLERFIPGCGPLLISHGCTVYTYIGELTPDDIYRIFLDFITMEEFAVLPFNMGMNPFERQLHLDVDEDHEEDHAVHDEISLSDSEVERE